MTDTLPNIHLVSGDRPVVTAKSELMSNYTPSRHILNCRLAKKKKYLTHFFKESDHSNITDH